MHITSASSPIVSTPSNLGSSSHLAVIMTFQTRNCTTFEEEYNLCFARTREIEIYTSLTSESGTILSYSPIPGLKGRENEEVPTEFEATYGFMTPFLVSLGTS